MHHKIAETIRTATAVIPNFPETGVNFIDITTVLKNPEANMIAIAAVQNLFDPDSYDVIVSPDARGWLLGQPMALTLKKPLVLVRKPGKLPRKTLSFGSKNEYNDNVMLEIHAKDLPPGSRVLVVDDVLATCGTALAIIQHVRNLGNEVTGVAALYDLPYLPKRAHLPCPTRAVVTYDTPPAAYIPAT